LAVGIAAIPLTLHASSIITIFNTFGPGHSSDCCSGFSELGSDYMPNAYTTAMAFTPSTTAPLFAIDMAISFNAGVSNQFTFALMTDSGGLPGSILESWSLTTTFFTGCAHCFETVFSTQQLVLQAGTQYWLVPFPNHTMDANWDQNVVGALGTAAFSLDGGKTWTLNPNSSMGAFDVRGMSSTTVPEPSTFGFMATGLAGIIGVIRRKRNCHAPVTR
jgi:hypothetical protein